MNVTIEYHTDYAYLYFDDGEYIELSIEHAKAIENKGINVKAVLVASEFVNL